ncbi:InlB B-repeat-containing protein [Paenibacillus sp. J5C_2022]|uniref:RCC1 domain-containing protein n=1 Tax=Paenibacillus sp. J5C2022 TaxID=2977129 RepID=UPI0021CE863B|nr:InlB B-repeat-containing protein [Paenibacillus sp. J5C2022]MCU6713041.1 InlB B-repeat-containing protein [Paenibacillus sp. J5C2022]
MIGIERKRLSIFLVIILISTQFMLVPNTTRAASLTTISASAGLEHSLFLHRDGTVWAWGSNEYGQLGKPAGTSMLTIPQQVEQLTDITAISASAGGYHNLALKNDGTVWTWGKNSVGQLGDGTQTDRYSPVQVQGLNNVVAIAAGADYSLALRQDGTVWAWGLNYFGQLGDGTQTQRLSPVQVQGLSDVTAITSGGQHNLALKSDDTVWAWGANGWGQLGDGTKTDRHIPVQIHGLSQVKSIEAGYTHNLAIDIDGNLFGWGSNAFGQLGNEETTKDITTPSQISGIDNVKSISAGGAYSFAIEEDHSVWAWGLNDKGQLGIGIIGGTVQYPQRINFPISLIQAGHMHSLAWADTFSTLAAWGYNYDGQLGDNSQTNKGTPTLVLLPASELPVTVSEGSAGGTTAITATVYPSHYLVIKLSNSYIGTPNMGDYRPTGTNIIDRYISGQDISGADTANRYLGIYEVNATNDQIEGFNLVYVFDENITPYSVTYSGNGNSGGNAPVDQHEYKRGNAVTVLGNTSNLTKTGYTFMGWNTTTDRTGTHYDIGDTFTIAGEDVTLYADWGASVTFDTDGGSVIPSQTVSYNDKVTVPANPTKSGHTFAGWYEDAAFNTPFDFDTPITAPLTLYAKWDADSFAVAFDTNGGSAVSGQSVSYNGKIVIPANPTKSGYTFAGWYQDAAFNTPFDFDTPITDPLTLYAKWDVVKYKVIFNTNGGSTLPNQMISYNNKVTVPVNPTKTGNTFAGWYQDAAFNTPFDFDTPIMAPLTLYAKWDADSFAVAFDTNGGSAVPGQSISYNGKVTVPANPTKTGNTFAGWYQDAAFNTPFDFDTPITAPLTLYAKWDLKIPDPPIHLTAIPGDAQVTLNWDRIPSTDQYNVYMSNVTGSYGAVPTTVTGATYTASGLANGTSYYFAVTASNAAGESSNSIEVSAVPKSTEVPILAAVNIASNNPNERWAKAGDTIALTFTSSMILNGMPVVTIANQTAYVTSTGGNNYLAEYTLTGTETEGTVPFTIDFTSVSGIEGIQVSATTDNSSVSFDNTEPTGTLSIDGGADVTNSTSVVLDISSNDGIGSGHVQMRFSNNGTDWSDWEATAAFISWTLTSDIGVKTVYMELIDAAGNRTTQAITDTILLQKSTGTSYDFSSNHETITVDIVDYEGEFLTAITMSRMTDYKGKAKDNLYLTSNEAQRLVDALAGRTQAVMIIPDKKDKVSEVNVQITSMALSILQKAQVELSMALNYGQIHIPMESLQNLETATTFQIMPLRNKNEHKKILLRAADDQAAINEHSQRQISLIGRPMIIHTNINQPVHITLPLGEHSLQENQLQDLVIFVEHSDGETELVQGELVPYSQNQIGIRFTEDKFSTFSILHIDGWQSLETRDHKAYITGYPDGTFRPDQEITRSEMAALLNRVLEADTINDAKPFTDVAETHWAYEIITQATEMNVMQGYPDGRFKPDQSISRAEMASIIVKLIDGGSSSNTGFLDTSGHWAENAIKQARAADIVNGYADGTFRPDEPLTRAEAVTIINKLLDRGPLSGTEPKWNDVPRHHWAYQQIQEASIDHTFEKKQGENHDEQYLSQP